MSDGDRRAPLARDPFERFRARTPARIGLGRVGDAVPTAELLRFQEAHAQARDAVHRSADFEALARELAPRPLVRVRSRAPDRAAYLRRPDWGRRLDEASLAALAPLAGASDLVVVVADGLSAGAVNSLALPLIEAIEEELEGFVWGPLVLAEQARVALGDEVGAALGADLVAVLIGERPGLSVPESLGIYLTWRPEVGRVDAERNCISNIHPRGLSPAEAAATLGWLAREARRRRLTGVELKIEGGVLEGSAET